MECSVAGISFRVKDSESIGSLRPSGVVELVHDPMNPFDSKAVMVLWEGHHIGFLPANSSARKTFFECQQSGLDIYAEVKDYCYAEYKNGKIVTGTFNNDHEGMLGSITLNIKAGVTDKHYFIDNKPHMRTTTIANSQDTVGFPLPRHLWEWEAQFETYEDYIEEIDRCADEGNRFEEGATVWLRDGDDHPDIPKGWKEICSMYQLEYVADQVLVVDPSTNSAGTLDMQVVAYDDAVKKDVLIDFKRSKKIKWSYLLQTAYYAYKRGCDELWVILFGSKNKCGYQIVKKNKGDIAKLYRIYSHLSRALEESREFKEFGG